MLILTFWERNFYMDIENKTSQKDAVVNAVKEVLGNNFLLGSNAKEHLSSEQLAEVKNIVANAIINGDVAFSKTDADEKSIRRYTAGLVDNHLRKAKELNGGQKYVPATTREETGEKSEAVSKRLSKTIDMSGLSPELIAALSI